VAGGLLERERSTVALNREGFPWCPIALLNIHGGLITGRSSIMPGEAKARDFSSGFDFALLQSDISNVAN